MEEHWSQEEVKNAKEWTIQAVKSYLIYSELSVLICKILLQMLDHWTTHHHAMTLFQWTNLACNLSQQLAPATASGNTSQAIHQGMTKLCALRQAAPCTGQVHLPVMVWNHGPQCPHHPLSLLSLRKRKNDTNRQMILLLRRSLRDIFVLTFSKVLRLIIWISIYTGRWVLINWLILQ